MMREDARPYCIADHQRRYSRTSGEHAILKKNYVLLHCYMYIALFSSSISNPIERKFETVQDTVHKIQERIHVSLLFPIMFAIIVNYYSSTIYLFIYVKYVVVTSSKVTN